mgnify:CR=1 FL=1
MAIRARAADGWTKERTVHDGPLSLDIADLQGHLGRRVRSLGVKEAVIEFGNIIYDRNFQQAFVKAFGKTTMDMWEPFLKDVWLINLAGSRQQSKGSVSILMLSDVARYKQQLVWVLRSWASIRLLPLSTL